MNNNNNNNNNNSDKYKIDITVRQFLNKFWLLSIDWFYCMVTFPDNKCEDFQAKWEISPLFKHTKDKDKDSINLQHILDFWGDLLVYKVELFGPQEGKYIKEDLDGVGMCIHVEFDEEVFK